MGLLRIDGGISGIIEYLVYGRKQGQTLSRDELDERVVLYGDIEITAAIIGSMDVAGQKYLHITFSVKERDLPIEKFREIDQFIREKLLAAYQEDELNVYSELQRPKTKNVINKATGEWHERLDHIHYAIPEKNLITEKKENPVGFFDHNVEFFEAIQELVNIKFGLESPKDNVRVNISHADIIGRGKDLDTFKKGAFKDLKSELINDIREKEIKDYEFFKKHLEGIGKVKVVNAGKKNEYLGVKVDGKPRFVNLQEAEFRKEFFDLPEVERALVLGAGHEEKQSSRQRPKRTEAEYEKSVKDWVDFRAKEVRYLNSGSKVYKKYFAGTPEEKAEILAYYDQRTQAQRLKVEKQYDDKYREQGRPTKCGRAAQSREEVRAGERIFAERAERDAFTRIMGGDQQSGLAVSSVGEAPRLGDRMRGLSQGDVAGDRWKTDVLVQSDARNELGAATPGKLGDGMQRAGAGSDGSINPATGRMSDTVVGQLLRDLQEEVRQEVGDQQPTIQDIKKYLSAERLLADLAESHKLRPEDYVISPGTDGGARIRHVGGHSGSMQKYNVSDFLTKHMHLSWSEAQPYLVQCYERQKNAVPIQQVASKARPDLYAEFQAERRVDAIAYPDEAKRDQERQRESEVARRSEINDRFIKAKASIKADPDLSAAQRKAQRSIAQMTKVEEQRLLGLEIQRERAELKRANSTTEQYRLWLQVKAQTGDPDALIELRRQSTGPARYTATLERIIAAADDKPDAGKLLEQAEREKRDRLQYAVERNGDVTYFRDGRELLLDTGRAVHMIEQSDEAIEQGLRLAAQKWGGKMQLTGSDEFIVKAITIAANKNMNIELADPVHKAMLQDMKHKIAIGKLEIANHAAREKQRIQDEADAARKNGKGIPTPGKTPTPGKQEKYKDKTGGNAGGPTPPTTEQPRNLPLRHQVVHPPEPDQDQDEGDREK